MDGVVQVWPSKDRQDEFFDRLRSLVAEFPELASHQARLFEDDPADECWTAADGFPAYDPTSPVDLGGLVVVTLFRNLDNFESMHVLTPVEQSNYLDLGLLQAAARMVDEA
jgi:hypothetical protein